MKLFGISDLSARWCYTKSGIHKLAKSKDFPLPIQKICRGRISIYSEQDILEYEKSRPWLLDEAQKIRRQCLYAKLQTAKVAVNPDEVLKNIFGSSARSWK